MQLLGQIDMGALLLDSKIEAITLPATGVVP